MVFPPPPRWRQTACVVARFVSLCIRTAGELAYQISTCHTLKRPATAQVDACARLLPQTPSVRAGRTQAPKHGSARQQHAPSHRTDICYPTPLSRLRKQLLQTAEHENAYPNTQSTLLRNIARRSSSQRAPRHTQDKVATPSATSHNFTQASYSHPNTENAVV